MCKSTLLYKKLIIAYLLIFSTIGFSATLNLTTKYGKTGGLRGNLNSVGDMVNGNVICSQVNTNANIEPGCDMFDDPGYVAGANTPVDDSYNGDLVVRTNDNFELIAAWSWLGNAGGAEEQVTISSTLPAGTNFIFDGIPGSCDQVLSTLSTDGKTMSCVRKDFDTNDVGSYVEDLAFAVRVEGDATNGDTPGALSMSMDDPTASGPVTDGTEGTSLVITASPRWNIDKGQTFGRYTLQAGRTDDMGNPGWWIWYNFSIEVDEVSGATDSPINPALGNEALAGGTNATITFTDDLSNISPNAKLVTWDTNGNFSPVSNACDMDTYTNDNEPYPAFNATNPDRSIQVASGVMGVTCTQTGSSVAVTVTGVDTSLTNAPRRTRTGGLLPVNRNIAAIGLIRVFVPLSDVVNAGGSLVTQNCVTGFDPNGISGGSNFGALTESPLDNCHSITLNAVAGWWDKNYRKGWSDRTAEIPKWGGGGWSLPPTDGSIVEGGDGTVTPGGVWGTYTVHSNTGGTPFTNVTLCDVIDTETYEMTIIDPTDAYGTAGTGVFDQTINAVDLLYSSTENNAGLTIEYATGYVGSWPPDPTVAPSTGPTDEVVDECSDPGITWYPDVVTAETTDGAPVSKVRISVPSLNPGLIMAMRIKHTARANFLTSGLPIPNDTLLINHATYTRDGLVGTVGGDGRNWRAGDYIALDATQAPPNDGGGDRLIMVRAKARILKAMGPGAVSPGSETTVTLSPSFTTDGTNPETGTVVIADLLPVGMDYKFGSTTGTYGSGATPYGEPLVIHPTTDADCMMHVADIVNEGFPCGDTLNGGATGTSILVWDLGTQTTGLTMNDLIFNGIVAIDALAPATLQNYVQISSSADTSPSSQRVANANTSNTVPSSLLIVKSVLTPLHEINSTTAPNNWMNFQIGLRNGSSGITATNLDFIDILPFNGDGVMGSFTFTPAPGTTVPRNRVPASNFSGTLEFDSVSFDDNGGTCDTTTLEYWYTKHAGPLDISPKNTALNDTNTGTSNWCQGTAAGPGGCDGGDGPIANADVTAFRVIGPDFPPSATCFVNVTYATAGANVDADIYSNTSGAEIQGVTNAVLSNTVSAVVFASSIGDTIWYDANNNGLVDTNEPLAGVSVNLTPPATVDLGNGPGVAISTTTDASGNYNFPNLPAGSYTVAVDESTLPVALQGQNSIDPDGGNNSSAVLSLPANTNNVDQDFAYFIASSIGDTIYHDLDNDGVPDSGEGIANVTVTLTPPAGVDLGNGPGQPITTTTDANGNYSFDNLPPGNYTVAVDETSLPVNLLGNNTQDPDGGNNSTSVINLAAGATDADQDFGYVDLGSIGDTIFHDINNNGGADPGEGVANITVTLTPPAGVDLGNGPGQPITTTTDVNGNYSFGNLPPGSYTVAVDETSLPANLQGGNSVDPDGGNNSTANIVLAEGESNVVQDFGYVELGSIGDTIYHDLNNNGVVDPGEGIANVTVTLTPPLGVDLGNGPGQPVTTMTDSNGNYTFGSLPAGNYTVTVDESTLPPVLQGNNTQDPDGGSDSTANVSLLLGEHNNAQDFGYFNPGNIGDTIYHDLDNDGVADPGEGIANITVTLTPPAGIDLGNGPGQPISTTTDANGNYNFGNLPPGNYTVTVDETGLPANLQGNNTQDPDGGNDSSSVVNLTAGTSNLDQDFGYVELGSIGDTIFHDLNNNGSADTGEGLANVTVILTPPAGIDLGNGPGQPISTTTDANGNYNFGNLPPGNYTVAVDETSLPANLQGGNSVDPDGGNNSSATVVLNEGDNNVNQDFGYLDLGSIGNTIYHDLDNDGVADPGEGIANVTVTLTPPAGIDLGNGPGQPITTTTDANGNYNFGNLPPGNYTITVDETGLPANLQGNNTQDPDGGNDSQSTVNLIQGENNTNQNFGYLDLGSIGDTIFDDLNGNGVADPGEGVGNVTVTLIPPAGVDLGNGPGQPVSTTTDSNGNYNFGNLPPGNYTVSIVENTLPPHLQGQNTFDPDGTNDSTTVVNLIEGQNNTSTDFGYTATNALRFSKTVYLGHDNGSSCTGSNNVEIYSNTAVTYCFSLTNNGTTHLGDLNINDLNLGINQSNLSILSGSLPLAPNATIVYYYETSLSTSLLNTATLTANPVNPDGSDIPGLQNLSGSDSANVTLLIPDMVLSKTVYQGHDNGNGCPGTAALNLNQNNGDVTYCFSVYNSGGVNLDSITVNDIDLSVNQSSMILVSGTMPLLPGQTIVWAYESTLTGALENHATATANPVDDSGVDIAPLIDEESSSTAIVSFTYAIPMFNIWSLLILVFLVAGIPLVKFRLNK